MGQQYYVIKRNPTPGSEAERIFLEKKAQREIDHAIRRGETSLEQIEAEKAAAAEAARGQRQQPKKGQSRAKRAAGPKPAEVTASAVDPELRADESVVDDVAAASDQTTPEPAAPRGQRNNGKKKK
jgi:YidC/Oxa1 family membrane protein insertase